MSISALTTDKISFNTYKLYEKNAKDGGVKAFLQRNVTCRGGYAAALIVSPFSSVTDYALGIIATIGSLLTLTLYKPLNEKAVELIFNGGVFLARAFSNLLWVINPGAVLTVGKKAIKGIVHDKVAAHFFDHGLSWSKEDSLLKKHVFSRAAFFGYALISLATRTADLVIGLFAAAASLLTLGNFGALNDLALSGLTGLCLLSDLFSGLTLTMNPWACPIKPSEQPETNHENSESKHV